jgi:hypothetical protein
MIATRPVKNNFNSAWVSVCAQAAEDQRAPPAANTNNPKTAARLSPILKIKNNEAGDGLAPDQRHEQIGANQHDGIVDDLAAMRSIEMPTALKIDCAPNDARKMPAINPSR